MVQRERKGGTSGYTLVELTIVLSIVALVMAAAIPGVGLMLESSSKSATLEEMREIKKAIVGNPKLAAGGGLIDVGYEGDIGALPTSLLDLAIKPAGVASYNRFTRNGWNGPYIDPADSEFLTDAWGVAYVYSSATRTITSTGSSENIVLSF